VQRKNRDCENIPAPEKCSTKPARTSFRLTERSLHCYIAVKAPRNNS